MKSRDLISILVAVILTIFAGLLFYYIIEPSPDKANAVATVGILSLVFSFIGYLLYAFVGVNKILRGFVWLYYVLGFAFLFISVTVLRFDIVYIILLLLVLAVSLILIRWRIGSLKDMTVRKQNS